MVNWDDKCQTLMESLEKYLYFDRLGLKQIWFW